ncbi:MAG TPA: hypothetical protein VM936_08410 [Pyrinomonadaceae bacterium]|nr:hypothetical protein [Pyrinomonadaceae bacterium]
MSDEGNFMEELFKSATSFVWATALFGARRLGDAWRPEGGGRASDSLDSVTRAAEAQLGDVLKSAFRAGDRLQRGLLDLTAGASATDLLTSRGMMRTALNAARQSANVLGQVVPGADARVALSEFQNKLQVFDLFEHADTTLGLPRGAGVPPGELVARTAGLDSFLAVWATEGVGHYYAETVWASRGAPVGLFKGAAARGLPAKSLAALHAGMGLSLANRLLAGVRTCSNCSGGCGLRGTLERFVALCRANSCDGYVGAGYEALGLVARNLYPHLVPCIDRGLREMGGHLAEFFWHGVGRAIYFAPSNYVPVGSAAGRALEMARREPPDESGRRNALAGLVWAQLLVNLRQPEVVENFLRQYVECGAHDDEAFANGVSSAAVIWRDSAHGDPHLEALCRHRPDPSRPDAAGRWRRLIETPCRLALDEYYGALKRHDRVGEVFRRRSLPELVEELEGAASRGVRA